MSESDLDKVIGRVTRSILKVFIPTIMFLIGLQVKAYFDVQHLKAGKVSKLEYIESQSNLVMLVERKTLVLESLAKTNAKDIAYVTRDVEELKEIQRKIDEFLREKYRVRGFIGDDKK